MLRLRDIMTTEVVTVSPETSLRGAMELFAHHHVSGAPVVSGDALVGVVSASDLMMFTASLSGVPTLRQAESVWPEDSESGAPAPPTDEEVSVPAFFADLWDDAGAEVTNRIENAESPEWNVLEEYDVDDVMTRAPLVTLPPSAPVELAAALMQRHHIHRVLVTENGALRGIVSALDIAGAVADHRFTVRQYVFNHDRSFLHE